MKASESRKEGLQAFLSGEQNKHTSTPHYTVPQFFYATTKKHGEYYVIPTGRF